MTHDIISRRLQAQRIAQPRDRSPETVVSWMGAVQAQDFAAAKWGIGLRAAGVTEADVDEAFAAGRILRTHVLRPTWHFVGPDDIRWMLALTAPRVHASNRHYYRKHGAEPSVLARSRRVLERALAGGRSLTRPELAEALTRSRIPAAGHLLVFLVMHAELEGVVCSGPRRGRESTYMLLDERVPARPTMGTDEALGELARRYFTSRAPATLRDFAWWSGLTLREARRALEISRVPPAGTSPAGEPYWAGGSGRRAAETRVRPRGSVDLLPAFDEYFISYADRTAIIGRPGAGAIGARNLYGPFVMVDGSLAGTWRRTGDQDDVRLTVQLHRPLNGRVSRALQSAAARLGVFLNRRVTVS